MSTPFSYPNGDRIDIFLHEGDGLFKPLSLSDYGQTSLYLRSAQIAIDTTTKKREILEAILLQLKVGFRNGDLVVELSEPYAEVISDAIFRLAQACMRVSEFASHQRLRSANPFRDDVESFLEASGLVFASNVKTVGKFKNDVTLDFEVFGRSHKSYVCAIGSIVDSSVHTSATETFRKWYDIAGPEESLNDRVTVYNSKSNLKDWDKRRLRDYSRLIAYPIEAQLLRDTLAA